MRNEHECKELLLDKVMTYFYYQNINNYAGYSWIFLKLKDLDSKIYPIIYYIQENLVREQILLYCRAKALISLSI